MSKNIKKAFYNSLSELTKTLPKQECNMILGDFNARLIERLPNETTTLGPHIYKQDNTDRYKHTLKRTT